MIYCVQIDKLEQCLASLRPLIDSYKEGAFGFSEKTIAWLEGAESVMSQLKLPEGSEMSALRGEILQKADEYYPPDSRPTRTERRKAGNAAAAQALSRAESVIRGRLLSGEERLQQFEDKLCEGLTAFLLENGLPDKSERGDHNEWLKQIWGQICEYQATRPLTIYLSAALTVYDRLYILDRVITRAIDQDLTREPPEFDLNP